MNPAEFWKNFKLGDELSIAGTFIYNGLRRFHEIGSLDQTDELFELLYNLAVGFERLLKIAVVLLELHDGTDQAALEQSLITHSHLDLLSRVRSHVSLPLAGPHNDFLQLLAVFYKSLRYGRFALASAYHPSREKKAIRTFLAKHLDVTFEEDSFFGNQNVDRYRKFVRGLVTKIANSLYGVVEKRASELNLYTYELRHGSKAYTVFLGEADIPAENILWKELLIFFMRTRSRTGILGIMKKIDPLEFDPALAQDYLQCFASDSAKAEVTEELEHHYSERKDVKERLELLSLLGNPNVSF